MTHRKRRFAFAAAAAIAVVLAVVLGIVVPGSVAPRTTTFPPRPRVSYRGSLVPATGAYLGAYVQSTGDGQQGEITAVETFEHELGGSFAVVHVYHRWGSMFPTSEDKYFVDHGKVLFLTWGGSPNTLAIVAGEDDAMIRATAEAVKALGHPILIEFRHEMDRPNLQGTIHGPANYIAAWDHIRAIFKAVGATNVGWVWCPTGYGFQVGRAQAFYPGDKEVDWVCADVYSPSPSRSLGEEASAFLKWASHHDKPAIIGEFGTGGNPSKWAAWLAAAGKLAEADRQIKALVYFDADNADNNGQTYAYRLPDHSKALSAFAGLLRQPFFHPVPPNDP